MKVVLLCLCLFVANACCANTNSATLQTLEDAFKTCAKNTNANFDELESYYERKSNPTAVPNEIKCLTKCIMETLRFLKSDGTFDVDAAVRTFNAIGDANTANTDVTKVVNSCKEIKGTDICDTAFKVSDCLHHEGLFH